MASLLQLSVHEVGVTWFFVPHFMQKGWKGRHGEAWTAGPVAEPGCGRLIALCGPRQGVEEQKRGGELFF